MPTIPDRRLGARSLSLSFALVGAMTAIVVMQLFETASLDAGIYREATVISGVAAYLVAPAVEWLRKRPGWRTRAWALVPLAGALVGAVVQWRLLVRMPEPRHYTIVGLDSYEPVTWTLAGAALGTLPAAATALVLWAATRLGGGSLDARERVLMPLAGATTVLGALATYATPPKELPVLIGIVLLATACLIEILWTDRARARWLAAVFKGEAVHFSLHDSLPAGSFADKPLVVGGVPRAMLVVREDEERAYRTAPLGAFAAVGESLAETVAPLVRRRRIVIALIVAAACVTGEGLVFGQG